MPIRFPYCQLGGGAEPNPAAGFALRRHMICTNEVDQQPASVPSDHGGHLRVVKRVVRLLQEQA